MWKRLSKIFKGFVSMFMSNVEKSNPKAILEAEKEEQRDVIAKFNENLAKKAGLIVRLKRMVSEEKQKEQELLAKVQANMAAGNQDLAGQYALQIKELKESAANHVKNLEECQKEYEELQESRNTAVQEARARISKLEQKLSEVEMKESEAELRERSADMVQSLGSGGESLSRLEESINERLEIAEGRAMVAKGTVDTGSIKMKASERKALESQALAELMSSMGQEYKPVNPVATAPLGEKEMGAPEVTEATKVIGGEELA